MIYTYKITAKTHLKLWPLLFLSAILIVLRIADDFFSLDAYVIFCIVLVGIQAGLAIPLHIDYYLLNKRDIIIFDDATRDIIFINGSEQIKFNVNDIKTVIVYIAYSEYKKTMSRLLSDEYKHVNILLDNNAVIKITNLLNYDFALLVEKERIKYNLYLYRWVKQPSLQLPKQDDTLRTAVINK